MFFIVSLDEGKMENPFHPLMSLYMIYSMSNYSLYYLLIIDDVELCQKIELFM